MRKRKAKKTLQKQKIVILLLSLLFVFSGITVFAIYNHFQPENVVHLKEIDEKQLAKVDFDSLMHITDFIDVDVDLDKQKVPPAGTKVIALTFDDGPGANSTQRILDILAKYDAKATFFCLGSKVSANPDMLKKIDEAGHEIASHSYSHPNLINLDDNGIAYEIAATNDAIYDAIKKKPKYLRPPYGSYNEQVKNISQLGIALWNVDSQDWQNRNGDAIYNQVMNTLQPNSIVLFHDIYESTADGVEKLVQQLASQGYKFITYSEMQQYIGG